MDNLKLVIFDCDGVLVDTEEIANQVISDSLKTYGLNLSPAQCMETFIGLSTENVKTMAEGLGANLPDNWVEEFDIEDQARSRKGVKLIPGVTGVLDALERAGIPRCVASNGKLEKMHITLGQHSLIERFGGNLFSAGMLGTAKPDPELFLHAAVTMTVPPENCVIIEDSLAGVVAAKRAGMKCFGYAPLGGGEELVAQGAILFDDMAKLPALLGL